MVLSQLLPKRTGDLFLIDEAGDLSCSLIEEAVPHLDEVEEVAEVGNQVSTSSCGCHSLGCLREASLDCGEDLSLVEGLLEVQEAGGGSSQLAPEEVQGSLGTPLVNLACVCAQVLALPVLPVVLAPGHVGPHVEGEDVAAREVGHIELLLVAQGVSLVPEKIKEVGEAGVVLVKIKLLQQVVES